MIDISPHARAARASKESNWNGSSASLESGVSVTDGLPANANTFRRISWSGAAQPKAQQQPSASPPPLSPRRLWTFKAAIDADDASPIRRRSTQVTFRQSSPPRPQKAKRRYTSNLVVGIMADDCCQASSRSDDRHTAVADDGSPLASRDQNACEDGDDGEDVYIQFPLKFDVQGGVVAPRTSNQSPAVDCVWTPPKTEVEADRTEGSGREARVSDDASTASSRRGRVGGDAAARVPPTAASTGTDSTGTAAPHRQEPPDGTTTGTPTADPGNDESTKRISWPAGSIPFPTHSDALWSNDDDGAVVEDPLVSDRAHAASPPGYPGYTHDRATLVSPQSSPPISPSETQQVLERHGQHTDPTAPETSTASGLGDRVHSTGSPRERRNLSPPFASEFYTPTTPPARVDAYPHESIYAEIPERGSTDRGQATQTLETPRHSGVLQRSPSRRLIRPQSYVIVNTVSLTTGIVSRKSRVCTLSLCTLDRDAVVRMLVRCAPCPGTFIFRASRGKVVLTLWDGYGVLHFGVNDKARPLTSAEFTPAHWRKFFRRFQQPGALPVSLQCAVVE